ncbi:MAG: hypothetical protein ACREV6_11855 [Clostridium sp.]|uniref:hypothetical protein n=1 Tax=Clostridium sp. TaxID=1506 RepID=UPI003D6D18A6
MQDNDSIININLPLYEKFFIADIVSVYPDSDNFNDNDCPPCRFTNPEGGGNSSPSSITIEEILDNKDMQVELDCQGRTLTIRVIYPNRNKENFHLDLLL